MATVRPTEDGIRVREQPIDGKPLGQVYTSDSLEVLETPEALAKYASNFMGWIRKYYSNNVAAAIWYAWAMGMHNGYALVGRDDQPLEPLYGNFLTL